MARNILYGHIDYDDPRIDMIRFTPVELGVELANGSNMCSVVVVALALNISLDEAYERMMFVGYEKHMLLNAIPVITKVLEDEYTYHDISYSKTTNGLMTVLDFISSDPHNNGYVILIHGHAFYCYGTTIYDGQAKVVSGKVKYRYSSKEVQLNRLKCNVLRFYKKKMC